MRTPDDLLPQAPQIRAEPVDRRPQLREGGILPRHLVLEGAAPGKPGQEAEAQGEGEEPGARTHPESEAGATFDHEPAAVARRRVPAAIRRSRARLPRDIP